MRRNSAGRGVKSILWLTVLVGKADRGYDSVESAGHKPVVFHAAGPGREHEVSRPLGTGQLPDLKR